MEAKASVSLWWYSRTAANDKVLEFVQASLLDLNLGDPEIIAGEVLVNIESDA
jgi:hypothetical protein